MKKNLIILLTVFFCTISLSAEDRYEKKILQVSADGIDSIYLVTVRTGIDSIKGNPIYKFGMCNTSGIEVVPAIYDNINRNGIKSVFTVHLNNKIGFYNIKGEELMPAEYNHSGYLINDYLLIVKDSKQGVFSLEDQRIHIPAIYDRVIYKDFGSIPSHTGRGHSLSPKRYRVLLERKDSINNARQQSLVDLQTGAILIPFGKYRDVKYSDKCGYVLTYTSDSTWQVFDFSGKLCLEGTKEKTASIRITPYGVLNLQNYHVGFIPFEGKTIKPIYKKISFFDNKLAITTQVDTINWEQKQGIITAGGEMLVKPRYNEIYMENNHIKVIVYGKTAHDHAKEGILNLNGKVIIAPDKYNTIEYFSEDNVAVVSKPKYNDDKPSDFGLIDSKGKILVPVKYRRVYHKNGIARLETHWPAGSNRIIMGMYNIKTRKMIEPKYDDMKEFVNGISIIGYFNSTGNRYGLLDENGNEIASPIYETMFYNDTQQYATVSLNKKQGMINAQGKVIVPIIFDRFTEYRPQNNKNGIVIGQNQNGYAVYNFYTEKEMLPLGKYDKVMCTNEGFLYTIHDRRIYCTPDGKEIVQQP